MCVSVLQNFHCEHALVCIGEVGVVDVKRLTRALPLGRRILRCVSLSRLRYPCGLSLLRAVPLEVSILATEVTLDVLCGRSGSSGLRGAQ